MPGMLFRLPMHKGEESALAWRPFIWPSRTAEKKPLTAGAMWRCAATWSRRVA